MKNNTDIIEENIGNSEQESDKELGETSNDEAEIKKSAKPQVEIN